MLSDAAVNFLLYCVVYPAILLIPAMGLLYQAACALSNREEPFGKSTLLGSLTFFPSAVAGTFIVDFFGSRETSQDIKFGSYHLMGIGAALLVAWLIGTIVYTAVYKGDALKAGQVSLFETLMRVLLGALVGGMYLVVMAIGQVSRDPEGVKALLVFGGGFAAFLAVVGLIFFVVWLLRNQGTR